MVQFDSIDSAKEALSGVKGTFIGNSRRIMVYVNIVQHYISLVHIHVYVYTCIYIYVVIPTD